MSDICNDVADTCAAMLCKREAHAGYTAASHQEHIGTLWTIDRLWYWLLVIKNYKTLFLILILRDWPKSCDPNLEVQREHHVINNPPRFTCQLIIIFIIYPPKNLFTKYKTTEVHLTTPKKDKINKQISKFYLPKNQMSQTMKIILRKCSDFVMITFHS